MLDCRSCPLNARCTTAPRRTIPIRTQEHHQALQAVRTRQKESAFWKMYNARSEIEGTISQGVRAFGMCRSRYRGMLKTHFQDLVIATALNLRRFLAWLAAELLAKTRTSQFAAFIA